MNDHTENDGDGDRALHRHRHAHKLNGETARHSAVQRPIAVRCDQQDDERVTSQSCPLAALADALSAQQRGDMICAINKYEAALRQFEQPASPPHTQCVRVAHRGEAIYGLIWSQYSNGDVMSAWSTLHQHANTFHISFHKEHTRLLERTATSSSAQEEVWHVCSCYNENSELSAARSANASSAYGNADDYLWRQLYLNGFLLVCLLLILLLVYDSPYTQTDRTHSLTSSSHPESLIPRASLQCYQQVLHRITRMSAAHRHMCRISFFVLHSYAHMLTGLRLPAYTPTKHMRGRQQQLRRTLSASAAITLSSPLSTPPSDVDAQYSRLYILGESHTLPLLWQWLTIQRRWYHCTPIFISGLKAYHFSYNTFTQESLRHNSHDSAHSEEHRPMSITAEMIRLSQHQKLIPLHSIILVVAGEIDCRLSTGMALAVSKGKYVNEDEAICTTVRAYVDGLCQLAHDRQSLVFVSPVRPPVLTQLKVKKSIKAKRNQLNRLYNKSAQLQQEDDAHNNHHDNVNVSKRRILSGNNEAHSDDNKIPRHRTDNDDNAIDHVGPGTNKNKINTDHDDLHNDNDFDQLNTVANIHRYALLIRTFNRAIIREIESRANTHVYYLNIYWQLCKGNERLRRESNVSSSLDSDVMLMDLTRTNDQSNANDYLMAERYTLEGQHCNALIIDILERVLTLTVQRTPALSTALAEFFSRTCQPMLPPPDERQRQLNEERAKYNQAQSHMSDIESDDHVETGIIMS